MDDILDHEMESIRYYKTWSLLFITYIISKIFSVNPFVYLEENKLKQGLTPFLLWIISGLCHKKPCRMECCYRTLASTFQT